MPEFSCADDEVLFAHTSPDGEVVDGLVLSGLYLRQCWVEAPPRPRSRSVLRNIQLRQMRHFACNVEGALLQNVLVDGLQGGGVGGKGPTFLRGCAFDRVTVRGRVSGLIAKVGLSSDHARFEPRYLKDNLRLYRSVDWALDISEAKFSTFVGFAGVPASLVRRDPDTQFVLTAEAAEVVAEHETSVWSFVARDLLHARVPDCVGVVGGSGQMRARDLEEAGRMRRAGLLR